MDPKDVAAISKLGEYFSPRETKKFPSQELDDELWEEGLRLGYRDASSPLSPEAVSENYDDMVEDIDEAIMESGSPLTVREAF